MARKFIPIENVASEGLKEDTASTGKLWVELENVRRGTGGWVKRPGTNRIDGAGLPSTVIGVPKLIRTFKHSGSSGISEVIRPNGEGYHTAQWTLTGAATGWDAVNEVTPDDATTSIQTSTKDHARSFAFDNLAGTFNAITSLKVYVRVARHATLVNSIRIGVRISGTDYYLADAGYIPLEPGTGWVQVSGTSTINPATSLPWTVTQVDALEVFVQKGPGYTQTVENVSLTHDYGLWSTYGDGDVSTVDGVTGGKETTIARLNYRLKSSFVASVLSWDTTPKTYLAVQYAGMPNNVNNTQRKVKWGFNTPNPSEYLPGTINTDGNPTSLLYITGKLELPGVGISGGYTMLATDTGFIAPATGPYPQRVSSVKVTREGLAPNETGELKVTQVYVSVEGDGVASRKNSLLLLTSKSLLRVSETLSTYSDILGTAAAPTASDGASWDSTVFNNVFYATNGKDQHYKFPVADAFAQESGLPIGATMASYSARLCLGDVIENSVRSDARFRWSAIDNAQNWTDVSSGNMELNETPGKIVKLKPIVEAGVSLVGVLVGYKQRGIYHLTPTDVAIAPFTKKLMDGSAGCTARGTVVGFSDRSGREAHAFLGTVGGTNTVLSWNGAAVQQIGADIAPLLDRLGDNINLEKAVAEVDTFGNYILLFPTADSTYLKVAVVYNFVNKIWSFWRLNNVTAIGTWLPNTSRAITVIGRPDSFAYKFDDALAYDDIEGQDAVPVKSILTTGNIALMTPEIWTEGSLERIWAYYEEGTDGSVWQTDITTDGGASYKANATDAYALTSLQGSDFKALRLAQIDTRVTGRKHGIRMQSTRNDGKPQLLQLILEVESAGILSKEK